MQLPPPDAILSSDSKTFEGYHFTKNLQNKVLKHKIKGFTLAEVLIALVIIGIIAVITVPLAISNAEEKERIAKIKKTVGTLKQAMIYVKADGGDLNYEVKDDNRELLNKWYDTYLAPRLITTRVCYDTAGCWNTTGTTTLSGSSSTPTANRQGIGLGVCIITAILNDGTFINIDPLGAGQVRSNFKVNVTGSAAYVFYFDINGAKKPNQIGRDIFAMVYTDEGLVPAYKDATKTEIENNCKKGGTGQSCLIKYLAK